MKAFIILSLAAACFAQIPYGAQQYHSGEYEHVAPYGQKWNQYVHSPALQTISPLQRLHFYLQQHQYPQTYYPQSHSYQQYGPEHHVYQEAHQYPQNYYPQSHSYQQYEPEHHVYQEAHQYPQNYYPQSHSYQQYEPEHHVYQEAHHAFPWGPLGSGVEAGKWAVNPYQYQQQHAWAHQQQYPGWYQGQHQWWNKPYQHQALIQAY